MITLDEAEALNRAGKGQQTVVITDKPTAKFRELAQRAAQQGWTCDFSTRILSPPRAGRCRVIAFDKIYEALQGYPVDFIALDDRIHIGAQDRAFLATRVKQNKAN